MKLTRSQLRILLGVVVAATVAGAAAPLASEADAALPGVTIREQPRQLPADEALGINSDCSNVEQPLAGGVRWAGGSSLPNNRILGIDPRHPIRNGIQSVVRDYDPGGTDVAVSIAICAPAASLPGIRARVETGGASGGVLTASCDRGEVAIGGGAFGSSLTGVQAIAESRPVGIDDDGVASRWRALYVNDSEPDQPFFVKVLCVERSDDFTVEVASSPVVQLQPGALAVATAQCPRADDQIAIGGGVGTNGSNSVRLIASQPGALVGGQPRSWTVIGSADALGPARELQAHAMCTTEAPPPPPPPPPPAGASIAFGSTSKLRLTRKGVARVALACSADASQRCQGRLTLKGVRGTAKRILRAKPVSFSIPAETTKRLKLKLSRRAQKLVRRAGRRGAKAKVTARLAGQARGVSRVVRLVGRG